MRIRNAIFCIALGLFIIWLVNQPSSKPTPPGPGPVDPPATSAKMLMLYDADNKAKLPDKGAMLDSPTFRTWLGAHHVDWRISPAGTVFNDDQPEFKKLSEQERKGDNWLYLDNGRIRGKISQPLPENEDAAEKLIGRYSK
jgi:hypothetical protein